MTVFGQQDIWRVDCYSIDRSEENADYQPCGNADRSWSGVVSGEPIHPDGVKHQDDPECFCGGRGVRVAVAGDGPVDRDERLSNHTLKVRNFDGPLSFDGGPSVHRMQKHICEGFRKYRLALHMRQDEYETASDSAFGFCAEAKTQPG